VTTIRTLVVCHYFPPEVGAPQARISESARAWAGCGEDVTVVTGLPNYPSGIVPDEYRRRRRRRERVDGYRVVRRWMYTTRNEGFLKRTLSHVSFAVSAAATPKRQTGPADIVMVSSPPFFAIPGAWLLARRHRAAFVVEVRDLWPDILRDLGVLTDERILRALEAIELWCYRQADAVVTVTEGFRADVIARGIPAEKVHAIPNGVDLERFGSPPPPDPDLRRRLGAGDDDVLVLYLGTLGMSQALSTLVDAGAQLSTDQGTHRVHVAIVGDGAERELLAERIAGLGGDAVSLHPSVGREDVPAVMAAADVCVVPLRDVPLFAKTIPSKLFELFAAERCVVGCLRGEAAAIVDAAGGVCVTPEDPAALAGVLRDLADDPTRRRQMGVQARRYVAGAYDRAVLAERYRNLLHASVDRRTGGSS